jgi:hypothetical protein
MIDLSTCILRVMQHVVNKVNDNNISVLLLSQLWNNYISYVIY